MSLILENTYGKPATKMKHPLDNIYYSTERLIKLVNDLLNISRIETGKIKAEKKPASLEKIIESVMSELETLSDEKRVSLKFDKPKKALPTIQLDKDKVRQGIINVIDNAIRYTDEGKITVRVKTDTDIVRITIKDTGAGMTKDEIEGLFQTFRRGEIGKKIWTGGSGLGLYIAKKFVEMHNGKIRAESKGPGKGSSFIIELPINNHA
jgi:signal transduction histidine kinase